MKKVILFGFLALLSGSLASGAATVADLAAKKQANAKTFYEAAIEHQLTLTRYLTPMVKPYDNDEVHAHFLKAMQADDQEMLGAILAYRKVHPTLESQQKSAAAPQNARQQDRDEVLKEARAAFKRGQNHYQLDLGHIAHLVTEDEMETAVAKIMEARDRSPAPTSTTGFYQYVSQKQRSEVISRYKSMIEKKASGETLANHGFFLLTLAVALLNDNKDTNMLNIIQRAFNANPSVRNALQTKIQTDHADWIALKDWFESEQDMTSEESLQLQDKMLAFLTEAALKRVEDLTKNARPAAIVNRKNRTLKSLKIKLMARRLKEENDAAKAKAENYARLIESREEKIHLLDDYIESANRGNELTYIPTNSLKDIIRRAITDDDDEMLAKTASYLIQRELEYLKLRKFLQRHNYPLMRHIEDIIRFRATGIWKNISL